MLFGAVAGGRARGGQRRGRHAALRDRREGTAGPRPTGAGSRPRRPHNVRAGTGGMCGGFGSRSNGDHGQLTIKCLGPVVYETPGRSGVGKAEDILEDLMGIIHHHKDIPHTYTPRVLEDPRSSYACTST